MLVSRLLSFIARNPLREAKVMFSDPTPAGRLSERSLPPGSRSRRPQV